MSDLTSNRFVIEIQTPDHLTRVEVITILHELTANSNWPIEVLRIRARKPNTTAKGAYY